MSDVFESRRECYRAPQMGGQLTLLELNVTAIAAER
jgi:hypothetical protein